jgi:hypothetical protein
MSLKTSALFALLCILVGIYAGYCIFDKPVKPNEKIVKQEEKKSGIITKKTIIKPDGTKQIDEIETYLSDRKNESVSVFKKTTLSIIPKYSFENNMFSHAAVYSYNGLGVYISSDKQIGLVLSLSY